MWLPGRTRGSGDVDLDVAPQVGPAKRWVYGVALAAVPVVVGAYCIAVGEAWLPGRYGFHRVTGAAAVAAALAYVGLGAFLHFHFFWAGQPKGWRAARIGKPLSLLVLVGGLAAALAIVILDALGKLG